MSLRERQTPLGEERGKELERGTAISGCLEWISEQGTPQSFILFYRMERKVSHPRDQADEVNLYVML